MTCVLTTSDVDALIGDLGVALDGLLAGFVVQREPDEPPPLRVHTALPGAGTAAALLPGLLPGVPAYTVKVNAKFPRARPALRGVVCLHALSDGRLLALLDSASVTAWRTGLAAALLTDRLAPRHARVVGLVGAGAQARIVLRALTRLRRIEAIWVHDIDDSAARALLDVAANLGVAGHFAQSAPEVALQASTVVMATWSKTPLLGLADLRPGGHVTTLGADEPDKSELAVDALAQAVLVVDDRHLAQSTGVLATANLGPAHIDATATEVLAGTHPGRVNANELTVYAPVGLPWQDLAVAWPLFQAAQQQDRGRVIDLLA